MPKKYKYRKTFNFDGQRYWVYADTLIQLGINIEKKKKEIQNIKIKETNITVQDWGERCIEVYKTGQSNITRSKYLNRVRHCIFEHIGNKPVRKVCPIDCQTVLNLQIGNSKTQINEVYQALKFIFKHAINEHLIAEDPTIQLSKPQGTTTHRRALTAEERNAVISVAKTDRRYYIYLLMIFCGCRPSEALECQGFDIKDIDGYNMLHIRGTKTKGANRYVPIPDEFFQIIKRTSSFDFISQNTLNNKITNRDRLWKSFTRQVNLFMGCKTYRNKLIAPFPLAKDIVPYCLRHEYCSDLARQGVDIRTAQKLMGHADIALTANIYTHVEINDIKRAAKLIGATPGTTQGTTVKEGKKG